MAPRLPDLAALFDRVVADFERDGLGEADLRYVRFHQPEYERTVGDLLSLFAHRDPAGVRILEIGAFFGAVSFGLKALGFRVTATDIREVVTHVDFERRYRAQGIEFVSCNLRDYALPFGDESFDGVVICETLEHLNFNPLPVLQEINRVLKPAGFLYVTVPNIASASNRLRLANGKSFSNSIEDFFRQLDGTTGNIVGLHWREYDAAELREMLERLGFAVTRQFYETPGIQPPREPGLRRRIKRIVSRLLEIPIVRRYLLSCLFNPDTDPALQATQGAVAVKQRRSTAQFHFMDATQPASTPSLTIPAGRGAAPDRLS